MRVKEVELVKKVVERKNGREAEEIDRVEDVEDLGDTDEIHEDDKVIHEVREDVQSNKSNNDHLENGKSSDSSHGDEKLNDISYRTYIERKMKNGEQWLRHQRKSGSCSNSPPMHEGLDRSKDCCGPG